MTHARTVAFALCVGLLVSLPAHSQADDLLSALDGPRVTLTLPKASGESGEEIDIPIAISNAEQLASLQLALHYDEKVVLFKSVSRGSLLGEQAIFEHNSTVPGRLGLGLLSGPSADRKNLASISGQGSLLVVRFKIVGRAGERSPLTPHRAEAWQTSNEKVPLQVVAGEVRVNGFPWWYIVVAIAVIVAILIGWRLRRRSSQTCLTDEAAVSSQ